MELGLYLVEAVVLRGQSPNQLARSHPISRSWLIRLLARCRHKPAGTWSASQWRWRPAGAELGLAYFPTVLFPRARSRQWRHTPCTCPIGSIIQPSRAAPAQ